jgi:hypothetical protein
MGEEIKIPERWKEDYEQCGEKSCLICTLIREIATLEQQLAERDRTIARLSAEWKALPDSQGYWWHWEGNPDVMPFIHGVLVSKTGPDRYFIQYPDSRWCDEVGGIWMKITPRQVPTQAEFDAIIAERAKETEC